MCSFKCSLYEVIKGEHTRVALDSRVTQQLHKFPTQIAYKLIEAGRSKDILQMIGLYQA